MKRLLLLAAAVVSLAACNLDVAPPELGNPNPSDPTTETFAAELKINISKMTKTASGAYYRDTIVGTGAMLAGNNGAIVWNYLGLLKNGALFATGSQQTVILGTLVLGLQEAMPGMRVGGERIIVIPSALGFGPTSTGPVPANSTLVYAVQLVGIP